MEGKKEEYLHQDYYAKDRHYEPKDIIRSLKLNFNIGCAVKYISRAGRKDGESLKKDITKSINYINFEIDELFLYVLLDNDKKDWGINDTYQKDWDSDKNSIDSKKRLNKEIIDDWKIENQYIKSALIDLLESSSFKLADETIRYLYDARENLKLFLATMDYNKSFSNTSFNDNNHSSWNDIIKTISELQRKVNEYEKRTKE